MIGLPVLRRRWGGRGCFAFALAGSGDGDDDDEGREGDGLKKGGKGGGE